LFCRNAKRGDRSLQTVGAAVFPAASHYLCGGSYDFLTIDDWLRVMTQRINRNTPSKVHYP